MSKHMRQAVRVAIDENNPAIVRNEDLCVECRLCAGICNEYVGVNSAYDLAKTGDRSICIHCGQCISVCPTNSLQILRVAALRTQSELNTDDPWKTKNDPDFPLETE